MYNEPAFPIGVDVTQNQWAPSCGMSLRDYFAAKVINGILPLCSTYGSAATESYRIADAMLKARQE